MIIFYHELDSLSSGAAILIINFIKGLTNSENQVLLINYFDGAIHNELKEISESKLSVIENDEESIRRVAKTVTSSDIIITTHFYSVFKLFKKANPRILFLCVNTTSLYEANCFYKIINFLKLTKILINKLKEKNGIIFTDEYSLAENAKQFALNSGDFAILPIPVVAPFSYSKMQSIDFKEKEIICFTYVGRAVDWKIFPVRKILKDLSSVQSEGSKVILSIITDNQNEFRSHLPLVPENVKLEFYENLSPFELNRFLKEKADIHFAMGTSALDGAKLGIPTILIDLAYSDFPDTYRYNFVYQTPPTFIGTDACRVSELRGMTMHDLLKLTKDKASLNKISGECFMYVKLNHEVGVITRQLENYISDCDCHISNIKSSLIRYWI